MIKQAYDLRKVNPRLVKKLQKYVLSAMLIIVLLLFGYRLFKVDTYEYYNQLNSREIIAEPKDNQTSGSLDSIVQTLNNNGIDVESYYNAYISQVHFKSGNNITTKNIHVAKDSRYSEGIMGEIDWLFKNDSLSDNGVYLDIKTYNELGKPSNVELLNWKEESYGTYKVEGVYTFATTHKYLFYGNRSFNSYEVVTSKILSKGLNVSSPDYYIETKKDISKQDLVIIKQLLKDSHTAIGNIEEADLVTSYIFNGITRMIIVVICLTLLMTMILIYQFIYVSSSILSTWLIYYMSNIKAILTFILSVSIQVLKPTLITGLVLTVLIVGINIYIGYTILLPVFVLLAMYVSIVFLASVMYLARFLIFKNTLNTHIEAECLK